MGEEYRFDETAARNILKAARITLANAGSLGGASSAVSMPGAQCICATLLSQIGSDKSSFTWQQQRRSNVNDYDQTLANPLNDQDGKFPAYTIDPSNTVDLSGQNVILCRIPIFKGTSAPVMSGWIIVSPIQIWIQIQSATQDGSNYRWTYHGYVVRKNAEGWDGWTEVGDADDVECFNSVEAGNTSSPVQYGNGIYPANLPSGFYLTPIGGGAVVQCTGVTVMPDAGSGSDEDSAPSTEYWFSLNNQIDGNCPTDD